MYLLIIQESLICLRMDVTFFRVLPFILSQTIIMLTSVICKTSLLTEAISEGAVHC